MSDFGAPGSTPPPAPSFGGPAPAPPPPPSYGGSPTAAPPPPPPQFGAPTAPWSGAPSGTGVPPQPYGLGTNLNPMIVAPAVRVRVRPAVTVAAVLVLVGGALVAIGSFVTWFSVLGTSFNGFSGGDSDEVRDGPVFLTLGLLLVAGGVLLLVMRRVLAVAIAAIVVAGAAIVAGIADLSDVLDLKDALAGAVTVGAGLYMCVIGGLIALGGGIAATAKRRR